jgi:heme-degrading monooxygenase HmoA
MPYGRCVIYSFAGDEQEIVEKSRAGVLPLLKQQPGFLAYGVIVQDGKIFSMSAWDTEADAKAADDKARGWVAENIDAQVVTSMVGDYSWLEFADGRA